MNATCGVSTTGTTSIAAGAASAAAQPPSTALDHRRPLTERALGAAAAAWLAAALLGQWAFFYYIAAFYGASIASGEPERWNRLQALGRTPYVPGDTAGNIAFAAHALGAGIVAFGGALQLVPQLRARAPAFHRWNGRLFLATVVALSLSGFYLVWMRGTSPRTLDGLSTSANGVLILGFAWLAWRAVRARRFALHRRWAMRLYLVSNAQWFLRVGVFAYFVLGQVFGYRAAFGDAFLQAWTFGCYLLPLAMLEVYFRAQQGGAVRRGLAAAALSLLLLAMLAGMVAFGLFSQQLITGAPLRFPG